MINPDFGGTRPTMFICGNSDNAKKRVGEIVSKFGFESEDMDMAASAGALEPCEFSGTYQDFSETSGPMRSSF